MIKLENNVSSIQQYLADQKWIDTPVAAIEKPGEGNMNFTLRLKTEMGESFIVKQSRDYVEKYPQVPAPEGRVLEEASFYKLVQQDSYLASKTPNILQVDEENKIVLMEDLGESNDFTFLYQPQTTIDKSDLRDLMHFAAHLHTNFKTESSPVKIPNREMRKLNHEHMFIFPFIEENGLNLDEIQEGLAGVAKEVIRNKDLKTQLTNLGAIYLADGESLLHGDYFPGSWLKTGDGLKIIDPEFCFFGPAEFEIGVCLAHLHMAEQSDSIIKYAITEYTQKAEIDTHLMHQFMAVEILRRFLGLAQLPLSLSLEQKKELITKAIEILTKS